MTAPGDQFTARLATLPNVALLLLGLFETALTKAGIDLPQNDDGTVLAYVTNGTVTAIDGPCLRVYLSSIDSGQPGRPQLQSQPPPMQMIFATWDVELWRGVPALRAGTAKSSIPPMATTQTSALQLIQDAAGLVVAARTVQRHYSMAAAGVPLTILPLTPISPEGKMGGNRVQVSGVLL